MSLLKKNGVLAKRNSKLQEVVTTPGDCGCCAGEANCDTCNHTQTNTLTLNGTESCLISGLSSTPTSVSLSFTSFSETGDFCAWTYSNGTVTVEIYYAKTTHGIFTGTGCGGSDTAIAGTWYTYMYLQNGKIVVDNDISVACVGGVLSGSASGTCCDFTPPCAACAADWTL